MYLANVERVVLLKSPISCDRLGVKFVAQPGGSVADKEALVGRGGGGLQHVSEFESINAAADAGVYRV